MRHNPLCSQQAPNKPNHSFAASAWRHRNPATDTLLTSPFGPIPIAPTSPPALPAPTPRPRPIQAALAVYWAILLTVTHLPQINAQTTPDWGWLPFDKTMHFLTFGGLAGLICWSRFRRTSGPWPNAALALGIGIVYGIIEEFTQPWFGRTQDWGDLVADTLGLTVGAVIAALLWRIPHGSPNTPHS